MSECNIGNARPQLTVGGANRGRTPAHRGRNAPPYDVPDQNLHWTPVAGGEPVNGVGDQTLIFRAGNVVVSCHWGFPIPSEVPFLDIPREMAYDYVPNEGVEFAEFRLIDRVHLIGRRRATEGRHQQWTYLARIPAIAEPWWPLEPAEAAVTRASYMEFFRFAHRIDEGYIFAGNVLADAAPPGGRVFQPIARLDDDFEALPPSPAHTGESAERYETPPPAYGEPGNAAGPAGQFPPGPGIAEPEPAEAPQSEDEAGEAGPAAHQAPQDPGAEEDLPELPAAGRREMPNPPRRPPPEEGEDAPPRDPLDPPTEDLDFQRNMEGRRLIWSAATMRQITGYSKFAILCANWQLSVLERIYPTVTGDVRADANSLTVLRHFQNVYRCHLRLRLLAPPLRAALNRIPGVNWLFGGLDIDGLTDFIYGETLYVDFEMVSQLMCPAVCNVPLASLFPAMVSAARRMHSINFYRYFPLDCAQDVIMNSVNVAYCLVEESKCTYTGFGLHPGFRIGGALH